MAQRMVRFSDLSNKIIDDEEVVRIVVEQHPALQNGPVEIEASKEEVRILSGRRRWYRPGMLGRKRGLWALRSDVAEYYAFRRQARKQVPWRSC